MAVQKKFRRSPSRPAAKPTPVVKKTKEQANPQHKEDFQQLLNDAVLGVK